MVSSRAARRPTQTLAAPWQSHHRLVHGNSPELRTLLLFRFLVHRSLFCLRSNARCMACKGKQQIQVLLHTGPSRRNWRLLPNGLPHTLVCPGHGDSAIFSVMVSSTETLSKVGHLRRYSTPLMNCSQRKLQLQKSPAPQLALSSDGLRAATYNCLRVSTVMLPSPWVRRCFSAGRGLVVESSKDTRHIARQCRGNGAHTMLPFKTLRLGMLLSSPCQCSASWDASWDAS